VPNLLFVGSVKADKEMFFKTVIFMPSVPGRIAKFKASFQPSYFAMICFTSDDGEDFSENYERSFDVFLTVLHSIILFHLLT
jgi:hypothetical protein